MSIPSAEQQLIARIQAGDRAAFGALAGKHRERLLRFLARRVHNLGDAEDLAQEALVRAYCAIDSFRGEATFNTWLLRIGLNMVRDFQAGEARRGALLERAGGQTPAARAWLADSIDGDDPEALYIGRQLAERLQLALAQMAPDLATALALREFEGLSYEAIAHTMDCPVTTVRSRLHRARQLLAEAVLPEADTPRGH